ncbi:MAG: ribosomal protein S18-alanine N-acetyltransferase [Symploca sp. SIO3C6]|uniref:Ribosomal protein S18-alanine N-acetyltransferase n=1 Tax=Symploca sp. SIO1C4 TaxID=2607765 RepID=A0A6B3N893_9CYAN|nr:ribosomal protein S18-alanine N-acetyltransferase [Symploca sp. SIO3C6]NER26334.1 ribosomal protein S18-alanine N-acetyltransferase [Symploca sp. SIO1C4]
MIVLELKPLTRKNLSAAVELDKLCFGGLWTKSGYERELDSPNSQLLVLEVSRGVENELGSSQINPQGTKLEIELEPSYGVFSPSISQGCYVTHHLIGLGCFWSILEEAHITIVAIHPNYQRQGLGKLLLSALLKDAIRHNLERATLEARPSNQAALSLYQKFGFTEAGRRRGYYQDTGEDALILWRSGLQTLEFEEMLTKFYLCAVSNLASRGWQLSLLGLR